MPLVSVFSSTTSQPSARIERWCLRLQQYTFSIEYRPGHKYPAVYLSRHPIKQSVSASREQAISDDYVQFIVDESRPRAISVTL